MTSFFVHHCRQREKKKGELTLEYISQEENITFIPVNSLVVQYLDKKRNLCWNHESLNIDYLDCLLSSKVFLLNKNTLETSYSLVYLKIKFIPLKTRIPITDPLLIKTQHRKCNLDYTPMFLCQDLIWQRKRNWECL